MKETIQQATKSLMRDMIKQSRARWAAQPEIVKAAIVRAMENDFHAYEAAQRVVSK